MGERRPETFGELERVWHRFANGDEICDGPVWYSALRAVWVGLALANSDAFHVRRRTHLRLLDGAEIRWLHEARTEAC